MYRQYYITALSTKSNIIIKYMLLTKLMTDGIYINNAMFTFVWRIVFVDKLSTGQYRPVFDCKIGRHRIAICLIQALYDITETVMIKTS